MPSPKTDAPLGREREAAGQLQAVGNLPQRSQLEGAGKKKTSRKLRLYIYSQDPCCNMSYDNDFFGTGRPSAGRVRLPRPDGAPPERGRRIRPRGLGPEADTAVPGEKKADKK